MTRICDSVLMQLNDVFDNTGVFLRPNLLSVISSEPVWQLLIWIPRLKLHKTHVIMLHNILFRAIVYEYLLQYGLERFSLCFLDVLRVSGFIFFRQ